MPIRSERHIAGIREASRIGRLVLDAAHAAVRPGVTTDELDRIVSGSEQARGLGVRLFEVGRLIGLDSVGAEVVSCRPDALLLARF